MAGIAIGAGALISSIIGGVGSAAAGIGAGIEGLGGALGAGLGGLGAGAAADVGAGTLAAGGGDLIGEAALGSSILGDTAGAAALGGGADLGGLIAGTAGSSAIGGDLIGNAALGSSFLGDTAGATALGGADLSFLSPGVGALSGAGAPGTGLAAAPGAAAPGAAAPASSLTSGVGAGASPVGSAVAGTGGGGAAGVAAPAGVAPSSAATGDVASSILGEQLPANASGFTALAPDAGTAGLTSPVASSATTDVFSNLPDTLFNANSIDQAGVTGGLGGGGSAVPGADSGGGLGDILGGLNSGVKTYGPLLSLGGLAGSYLMGNKQPKYAGNVAGAGSALNATGAGITGATLQPTINAANQQIQSGEMLQNYLTSGTLPPGLEAGLNQATNDAAATIRAQYAARGQTGSSAEATDLANLQQTAEAQSAQQAASLASTGISEQQAATSTLNSLLSQGLSASEYSSQIYADLMQTQIQQDTALSNSIANYSGALAKLGAGGNLASTGS